MQQAYDYIIVGAGSAGCVLAGRLTEDAATTVLLIDAGPRDGSILTEMPGAAWMNFGSPRFNWAYRTVPQAGLGGQKLGLCLAECRLALIEHLLTHDLRASERFGALDFGAGQQNLRVLPGDIGFRTVSSNLEGALIEREQQVTGLDQRAILEMDLLDKS